MSMKGIQHLSIEIGQACQLSHLHTRCPAHGRVTNRDRLSTERIAEVVRAALALGFGGWVGFHFYNEPTLYTARMREVMDAVPEARYMLWTNSTGPVDARFGWVQRSNYADPDYQFDARLTNYDTTHEPRHGMCQRPYVECAIDYSGRVALCCQDWRLSASPADVSTDDPTDALLAWRTLAERAAQGNGPEICKTCKGAQ